MYILVLFALLPTADPTLEKLTKDLAQYYSDIKSFHLAYVESEELVELPPPKPHNLELWREWVEPRLKDKSERIVSKITLWDSLPTIRLDRQTTRYSRNGEQVQTGSIILKDGDVTSFSAKSNGGTISKAKGLQGFNDTPPTRFGLRVPGSISTSLAEIMSTSGVTRIDPTFPHQSDETVVVVGPQIPRDICSGFYGRSGKIALVFSTKFAPLPRKVIHYYLDVNTKANRKLEDEGKIFGEEDLRQVVDELSDFRPVRDVKNNRTVLFPFLMRYVTVFNTIIWRLETMTINPIIPAETFRLGNSGAQWVVHGKVPVVKAKPETAVRRKEVQSNVQMANELLQASNVSAQETTNYGSWTMLGVAMTFIAIGVYFLVRRSKEE